MTLWVELRHVSESHSTVTWPEAKTPAQETESPPWVVTTRRPAVAGLEGISEGEVDKRQVSGNRPYCALVISGPFLTVGSLRIE